MSDSTPGEKDKADATEDSKPPALDSTTTTSVTEPRRYIHTLNSHDVLLGRGQHIKASGNTKFRALVRARVVDYATCRSKAGKDAIARQIVKQVEERGGRFIRRANLEENSQPEAVAASASEPVAAETPSEGSEDGDPGTSLAPSAAAVWEISDEATVLVKVKQTFRDYSVVARKAAAAAKKQPPAYDSERISHNTVSSGQVDRFSQNVGHAAVGNAHLHQQFQQQTANLLGAARSPNGAMFPLSSGQPNYNFGAHRPMEGNTGMLPSDPIQHILIQELQQREQQRQQQQMLTMLLQQRERSLLSSQNASLLLSSRLPMMGGATSAASSTLEGMSLQSPPRNRFDAGAMGQRMSQDPAMELQQNAHRNSAFSERSSSLTNATGVFESGDNRRYEVVAQSTGTDALLRSTAESSQQDAPTSSPNRSSDQ